MSDFTLRYAGFHVDPGELKEGECTIRLAKREGAAAYPLLWFFVRDDEGVRLEIEGVPIAPNGSYTETGIGGRTWGFMRASSGVWVVSPSINVLPHPHYPGQTIVHAGEHPEIATSSWHHTPQVVGVPDGEAWQ